MLQFQSKDMLHPSCELLLIKYTANIGWMFVYLLVDFCSLIGIVPERSSTELTVSDCSS
jgi:hypothetical protein